MRFFQDIFIQAINSEEEKNWTVLGATNPL
jgi:hypothetical protein